MRLTKRCEHGLKAAVQLALNEQDGYLQAKEIAAREDLPGKFIESILSALRESTLLISKVGARGGYKLARPATQISVASIIDALEVNNDNTLAHVSPSPGTNAMTAIQQHIDDAIENTFGSMTLESLAKEQTASSEPVRVEIKPYKGVVQTRPAGGTLNRTFGEQTEKNMPHLVLHTDTPEPANI